VYKRIMLPLDGSTLAEQALPHAVALAECFQAELIIIKVLEPLAKNTNLPPTVVRKAKEEARKLALDYLDRVAADARDSQIAVRVITIDGRPHEEIVHFAEEEQVDLIVISTRGYSGLSRWLMGSVADRVTRAVNVPVLLVRTRKE
jgi:nucleotide-binding universal stress UspA family protein